MIGAGKSTLAAALAEALGMDVFYEPVEDNVYLEDFYTDMKGCAFAMQIWLLNKRFMQQQRIVWSGRGAVQDRTIYEDAVFARMLAQDGIISERDLATYLELFEHMSNLMRKPTVIIHLDVTPEESMRRIGLRARACESTIGIDYLRKLYSAYEDFVQEISKVIPVIRIDYREFVGIEEMVAAIKVEYEKIHNIRHIRFEK
jgi:deoxyadenosine kinase